MAIAEHRGDLLSVNPGILVHGCNCHGVMGGGIAKAIRDRWPDVYLAYADRHKRFGLQLGDVVFVASASLIASPARLQIHAFSRELPPGVIVANAMTQQDFGSHPGKVYVDYDAIEAAFVRIRMVARAAGLAAHFPLIGCGLAQGRWEEVRPRIEAGLREVEGHLWTL